TTPLPYTTLFRSQKETIPNQDRDSFIQLDQKFHIQIIHDTNYHLVEEFFMRLHDLTVLIGHQVIRKKGRMNEVIAEHEAIIHAMEKRDVDAVQNQMLKHLDNRSEEHTSEPQSRFDLVCRLLHEKTKPKTYQT